MARSTQSDIVDLHNLSQEIDSRIYGPQNETALVLYHPPIVPGPSDQGTANVSKLKKLTMIFSSSRVGVTVAIAACIVGAYYAWGQYTISVQSWKLGIWKDCRDRIVSV